MGVVFQTFSRKKFFFSNSRFLQKNWQSTEFSRLFQGVGNPVFDYNDVNFNARPSLFKQ